MSVVQPNLTAALARALSAPPNCKRLVLTLEAGQMPIVEYECHMLDGAGKVVIEHDPQGAPDRIRAMQFMVRLEPFK